MNENEVDPKVLAAAMREAENNVFVVLRGLRSRGMRRMLLAFVAELVDTADQIERGQVDPAQADRIAADWAHDARQVERYLATMYYAVDGEQRKN